MCYDQTCCILCPLVIVVVIELAAAALPFIYTNHSQILQLLIEDTHTSIDMFRYGWGSRYVNEPGNNRIIMKMTTTIGLFLVLTVTV